MNMDLFWLDKVWQQFHQARLQQRLPHAILLHGPEGLGKARLARRMAASLLCQQPGKDGNACGACQPCRWLAAGHHPDLLEILPEETGKAIKVEQIRSLSAELAMTSHSAAHKVALIHPADAMNINAANSLLKTLEEPTDNTLILLVTAAPGRLPITVKSRCQALKCPQPARQDAEHWLLEQQGEGTPAGDLLELAGGAPLLAIELLESNALESWRDCIGQLAKIARGQLDPLQVAAAWYKAGGEQQLAWFLRAQQQLLRTRQAAGQVEQGTGLSALLQQQARVPEARKLFSLMDETAFGINQWASGLNRQLILEDLLIRWSALFVSKQGMVSGQN